MKIRKASIPAAGLGTRFLPATKALPKEMLPIVEEAKAAGIEDILTQDITNLGINLYYTRQPHPAGLGDAIYRARSFVGEEPFIVMLGDDLMNDKVTLTKQLIDEYDKTHASTMP